MSRLWSSNKQRDEQEINHLEDPCTILLFDGKKKQWKCQKEVSQSHHCQSLRFSVRYRSNKSKDSKTSYIVCTVVVIRLIISGLHYCTRALVIII